MFSRSSGSFLAKSYARIFCVYLLNDLNVFDPHSPRIPGGPEGGFVSKGPGMRKRKNFAKFRSIWRATREQESEKCGGPCRILSCDDSTVSLSPPLFRRKSSPFCFSLVLREKRPGPSDDAPCHSRSLSSSSSSSSTGNIFAKRFARPFRDQFLP